MSTSSAARADVSLGTGSRIGWSAAFGAPVGAKMRTSTALASGSRARSIRGSTSRQSNPPLPQPRGGIAMEVMPSSRITRVRSRRPGLDVDELGSSGRTSHTPPEQTTAPAGGKHRATADDLSRPSGLPGPCARKGACAVLWGPGAAMHRGYPAESGCRRTGSPPDGARITGRIPGQRARSPQGR